jgi:hypothetical protein
MKLFKPLSGFAGLQANQRAGTMLCVQTVRPKVRSRRDSERQQVIDDGSGLGG